MESLWRWTLWIGLVLLVPIVPFLLWGASLESAMDRWLSQTFSSTQTAALIVGLLATDVLLPVPASLVSTFGGGRLGWLGGTAASWLGMSLGAVLGFAIARYGGRPLATRLSSEQELRRLEDASARFGPALLVLTRAVPILAEASVLLMGLERLAWRRFLPPVLLSNLGIALAYSAFGDLAAAYEWLPVALGLSLALPLLLVAIVRRRWAER